MANQSARIVDSNGFMLVKGCPLSREGIYEYSAKQIGLKEGDPNRIVKVYRPEYAVKDPVSMASFKSVPFIDEHEMLAGIGGAHPEYSAPEEKGIDGIITDNVWFDESDGWMKGDVKVFTRKMQNNFKNGKEDLSLGFGCKFLLTPGSWNGQDFEVIQVDMRGNHCANVEEGRVDGARVLDSMCFDSISLDLTVDKIEDNDMKHGINGSAADSALEQLKALVPALQSILAGGANKNPTAAEPTAPAAKPNPSEPEGEPAKPASEPKQSQAPPEGNSDPQKPAKDADPTDPANVSQTAQGEPEPSQASAASQPSNPASPASTAAQAEPAAPAAPAQDDCGAIIQQVEDLLAQIKASLQPAAATDAIDPTVDPSVGDQMEGKAQDAALKRFYVDQNQKNQMYDRLSKVIGAFDHAAMDSKDLAVYGAGKLGISCKAGSEVDAVQLYLDGLVKGQNAAVQSIQQANVGDSSVKCPELDSYLKQGGE